MQTISSAIAEGKHTGLPAFLGGLPWLLVRFKAALKRSQSAEPAKASQRGANPDSGAVLAEFGFFALLLQLLMNPILAASQVWCIPCATKYLWLQLWKALSLYMPSACYVYKFCAPLSCWLNSCQHVHPFGGCVAPVTM